jgi:hypothetical protein
MLGHASIKVTIDLYSHALPEATTEVANVMQQALTGTKKPTPDALISSRVG